MLKSGTIFPALFFLTQLTFGFQSDTIPTYRKFAPLGATWSDANGYVSIVSKDTMVNGVLASFIEKNWPCSRNCDEPSIIYHNTRPEIIYDNREGQVYYWIKDSFYLLYDFAADLGDTLSLMGRKYPYDDENLVEFDCKITQKKLTRFDEVELISYFMEPLSAWASTLFAGWVFESLGNETQLIPTNLAQQDAGFFSVSPDCYRDSTLKVSTHFQGQELCNVLTNQYFLDSEKISVFPNPASDFIEVKSNEYLIKSILLRSMNGQVMKRIIDEKVLPMGDVPQGIYILSLHLESSVFFFKIFKI